MSFKDFFCSKNNHSQLIAFRFGKNVPEKGIYPRKLRVNICEVDFMVCLICFFVYLPFCLTCKAFKIFEFFFKTYKAPISPRLETFSRAITLPCRCGVMPKEIWTWFGRTICGDCFCKKYCKFELAKFSSLPFLVKKNYFSRDYFSILCIPVLSTK